MRYDEAVLIIRKETGCNEDRAENCADALLDAGLLNASNLSEASLAREARR